MNHFTHLQEFIRSHADWQTAIHDRPFGIRISPCPFNSHWFLLMYTLRKCDFSLDVVKECRGTVVDDCGNIICAPYTKFFNYDDVNAATIDWQSAVVREKIDGVLIKMFKHNGKAYWVSNGGWDIEYIDLAGSPYRNADQLLASLLDDAGRDWIDRIPDGYTLMFELVSPYCRIICFYNESKLWFHGLRDSDGNEMTPEEAKERFGIPFDTPKKYSFKSLEAVQESIGNWNSYNQEGVVVCDKNFNRIKIKCDDYLKTKFHNIANTLRRLWQIWAEGSFDDLPQGESRWRVSLIQAAVDKLTDRLAEHWESANRQMDACGRDYSHYAKRINELAATPLRKNLCYVATRVTKDDFLTKSEEEIRQSYAFFVNLMTECKIDLTNVITQKYEPEDESEQGYIKFNKQKPAE